MSTGITIMIRTSDFRAVRGLTIVGCLADEAAFWPTQGVSPDKEIFAAIRPAMSTIPNSKLFVSSSPYGKTGELYEAYRDYFGVENDDYFVWQAPTRVMNPTVPQEFIDKEIARDPDAGGAEWLAQFREDVEAAFSAELIEACVIPHRGDLPPSPELSYRSFDDVSGGRGDYWTKAIGHTDGNGKIIIDCMRAWKPPFDPSVIAGESAQISKAYRCPTTMAESLRSRVAQGGVREARDRLPDLRETEVRFVFEFDSDLEQ